MAQKQDKLKALRRREMALRATWCRSVAISRGRRWCTALIDVLADYGALGPLPYPTQETLAERLGVHERTVRRWTRELEALGVLDVFVSPPQRDPATGQWCRRQSNRYLLADQRARKAGPACPLPRRRPVKPQEPPTGHECPVTPTQSSTARGPAPQSGGPPELGAMNGCDDLRSPTATHHQDELSAWEPPDQEERARIAAIRAGLRSRLGPTRRHLGR